MNNNIDKNQLKIDKIMYGSAETYDLTNIKKHTENTNKVSYHNGPVNKNFTYDDSFSRTLAKQLFQEIFNIELIEHPGLYIKERNKSGSVETFALQTDGKYCEDLMYIDAVNKEKHVYVEVERSNIEDIFDTESTEPVKILVSKYWKYFHDGNKNHTHYMCFINEELKKACVIKGSDIKFHRGKYCTILVNENEIKEFYEIDKKYCKIYDLKVTAETLLANAEINYLLNK